MARLTSIFIVTLRDMNWAFRKMDDAINFARIELQEAKTVNFINADSDNVIGFSEVGIARKIERSEFCHIWFTPEGDKFVSEERLTINKETLR